MVGLANVDNTSDANKPVSTAAQTALDLKAPLASPTFTGTVSGITKTMVGLANVDNTSDANKPVSTAAQTALDLKAPLASPTLTGAPLAPTATAGNSSTQIATTEFVGNAITTANATNANLTGPITSSGNATSVASQTGTGSKFVMDTSPTLVTPTIGVATATSVNKVTITAPTTSATLTIANGKTLTSNNSLTLAGTDATTMTFPSTSATIARTDAAQTFTGTQTFSSTIAGSISGNAATVTTNANLTGDVTSSGNATTIGTGKVTNSMLAGSIDLTSKVSGSLPIANGGTGASTATQNYIFAGPASGSSVGAPSFRALVAADMPTLNQNTTGTATNVTGTVAVSNGGTGASTLTGLVKGNGTSAMTAAVAGTDYMAPSSAFNLGTTSITLNRSSAAQVLTGITSIDGSAAKLTIARTINGISFDGSTNVTGTIATNYGGTGLTSFTNGGAVYATSTSALTTGTLPVGGGGTGIASYTSGDLLYANGTTSLTKLAKGSDGQLLSLNGGNPTWINNSSISGSGSQNYLTKYNNSGGTTLGNSMVFDNGTSVGINTAIPGSTFKLDVNGAANFASDIVVNGIKIGKRLDPGYEMYATSYGVNALANYVVGAYGSTAFGNNALQANTSGAYNNAFGIGTLASLTTGSGNTAIGSYASNETSNASNNVIIGHEAGRYLNTAENTIIGYRAGQTCCTTNSTNIKNIYIGSGSGNGTTGSKNVIIGSYGGGSFSNNIILADGDGNIRARHDGTKWTLNGLDTFSSNLTINGMIFGKITGLANHSPVEGVLIGNASTKGNSISIGRNVLSVAGGDDNIVIGQDALSNSAGNPRMNTVFGNGAGANSPGGVYGLEGNVFIGRGAGAGTQGNSNLIIGNVAGGAFSNNIILADGDGTIRYRWDGTTNNFNTGSVTAASFTKSGGTSSQYLMADGSTSTGGGVTSISGGSTGLTPTTATTGAVTLAGTLAVANGGTGATTAAAALTNLGAAPLASPSLTGTPLAPTATAGTNTTQIATTQFVTSAITTANGTNANLTGPITSTGNATSVASQTGTGTKFVMDTSPTLVTPTLGVATAISVNKVAITTPATSATLTIADGKTLSATNNATVSGTNTGDQTITLTGAVTGSGTGSFETTLADAAVTSGKIAGSAVTYAKIQNITAGKLLGSTNNSAAAPGEVTIGTGLSLSSSGTLTASGSGGTVTSVAALNIGTTGTNITSSVATSSTTPIITLNIPDASATARGVVTTGTQTFEGVKTFKNNVIGDGAALHGFEASLNKITGTTYTLEASDKGKVVTLDNSSSITVTILNNLGDGFNCLIVQKGTGKITISAGTGVTLINRQSHTKTAGQYAVVTIVNIGTNQVILAGDTGN